MLLRRDKKRKGDREKAVFTMLKTLSCDHQGLFNDISHDFLASLNMDGYPLIYLI
jgi:hypothetical protein